MTEVEDKLDILDFDELLQLINQKLQQAGLPEEQAEEVANHLVDADFRGIHSHGAVRVEYYVERICKGGVTLHPQLSFERTGESTGIFHGDNGIGQYVVNEALPSIVKIAKETGVAIVGISKMSHSGTMTYYLDKIAREGLIGITMCQSDPMVVPFGGAENYFGTNPIGFAVPRENHSPIIFDMATTVQAWGKILDARSKNQSIPATWAVDSQGKPTTDPHAVQGLLPISGAKGYGLMMMVDILAGSLLGLPFGKHVTSMYSHIAEPRNLGQIFIVIDPERFAGREFLEQRMNTMVEELHTIQPSENVEQVLYPGELNLLLLEKHLKEGVGIPSEIVAYLRSDLLHEDRYGGKGSFA
ncbi:ureidoglycolate dehydrogenase [Streptococcus sp. A23]|uniref:ureidoglycolate dehydrogenase n=1 Tax=Streptococcus TaxID=1301 RepID=UPI000CF4EF06|nr:ureidoglycolate dehydrogenase [Streptococcus suis]